MSFTFGINNPTPILWDNLHAYFPPNIQFLEQEQEVMESSEHFPQGHWHVYMPGKSARAVELGRDEQGYSVRIMSCSNEVDYQVALNFVRAFATLLQSPVEPEDAEAMSLADLETNYGSAWVKQQVDSLASMLIGMVDRDQQTLTMHGCERSYHLGPNHLAKLRTQGNEDDLPQRLLRDIVRVQHVAFGEVYDATLLRAQAEDGTSRTIAVVGPGVDYFLPSADVYALVAEEPIEITAEVLERQAELYIDRVDEAQFLLEAIEEDVWEGFVERCAAEMAIT